MKRSKDRYERDIFRRFSAAARLRVHPRSVRSCTPPRPDISCRIAGVPQYFELTRIAHRGSANAMGHYLSQLTRTGSAAPLGADCYDDRVALREAVARKARKNHQTGRRPSSLLIYIDGVFHPPRMPPEWARTILEAEGPTRRWSGIWLYDAACDRIIASWQQECD